MLTFSQSKQGLVRFSDASLMSPVAWRHAETTIPVLAAGAAQEGLSGILVQGGKTAECPALSRCSLSLFNPVVGVTGAPRPAVPFPMSFVLHGSVGGQWVPLKGFAWVPLGWVDPGVVWWDGGLVEGFALSGGVDAAVGAVQIKVGVRWLADRVSGPGLVFPSGEPGTMGFGPGMVGK